MAREPARLVLRAPSGIITLVLVGLFCLYLLIDALARGALDLAAASAPWLALIAWIVYLVLVRPCVILDERGITMVNVLRVHHAPWSAVETVRSRFQVRVELTDGGVIRSWGAPTSSAGRRMDAADPAHARYSPERREPGNLPIHRVIDRWRDLHEPDRPAADAATAATTTWDTFAVVVTAAIAVWCALTFA